MRLLLFCPTYRLEPETVGAILGQAHRPIDILFTRDNPFPGTDRGRANILHNYRKGRLACLDGGYDAMLCIESDIMPPLDCAERLIRLEADVAYGLYAFRVTSDCVNVAWRHVDGQGKPGRNPGEALTTRPSEYRRLVEKSAVIECSGAGTGCVLIRRRVLEQIDFRLDPDYAGHPTGAGGFPDTYFTQDVYRAGYSMKADLGCVCGHKREDGVVIWPPYTRPMES